MPSPAKRNEDSDKSSVGAANTASPTATNSVQYPAIEPQNRQHLRQPNGHDTQSPPRLGHQQEQHPYWTGVPPHNMYPYKYFPGSYPQPAVAYHDGSYPYPAMYSYPPYPYPVYPVTPQERPIQTMEHARHPVHSYSSHPVAPQEVPMHVVGSTRKRPLPPKTPIDESKRQKVSLPTSTGKAATTKQETKKYTVEPIKREVKLHPSGRWEVGVHFRGKRWHIGIFENNTRAEMACIVAGAVLEQNKIGHMSDEAIQELVHSAKASALDAVERSRRANFNQQRGVAHLLSGKWRVNVYFQDEYRLIGEFETKESASLACEIAHAIFKPKQDRQMRSEEIQIMVHSAQTAAWNATMRSR